jgi:hypothetical protein
MKFTKEDKEEYISYLASEIIKTQLEEETIFTNHYIANLRNDLSNIKNNLK